ncbi:MAG: hypothetical protein WCP89_04235 [archaeon]
MTEKNNRRSLIEETILKTAIVYDSIIRMEEKGGKIIPLEDFIKTVLRQSEKYQIKFTQKEINFIIFQFCLNGFIFRPKEGYIHRI